MDDTVEKHPVLCPFWEPCGFVQSLEKKMGELAHRIYTNHCTDDSSSCARRHLYENGLSHVVPPLMLPRQTEWARQIREEVKSSKQTAPEQTEVR